MNTRRCECGQQLWADERATAGQMVCPRCGRAVTPNGWGSGPQANGPGRATAYSPPGKTTTDAQGENAEAVVGFIIAIMSIFTCMLLAPIAVFFSFRGLKKPANQGLAIAGMVLGILQTVGLAIVMGYFLFVFLVVGGVSAIGLAAAETAKKRLETDVAIEAAKTELTDYHVAQDSLPSDVRGKSMISAHDDAWGSPLQYERTGDDRAIIKSAGPDRVLGTDDDISIGWAAPREAPVFPEMPTIARPVPGPLSPLPEKPEITTVDEALSGIDVGSVFERKPSLEFLRDAKPDDEHRDRVVRAVLPLVTDFQHQQLAQAVLAAWATEEHADAVLSQATVMRSSVDLARYGRPLVELLGKLQAGEQLATLITHRDTQIADAAAEIAKQAGVDSKLLAHAAVEALTQEEQTDAALRFLSKAEPVDSLRAQLNKNIGQALGNPVGFRRREAVAVLTKWGVTSASLDALAEAGEYELVASVKSEQSLRLLGEAFRQFPINHAKAARILKDIGPAAEPYVWPALEDKNLPTVMSACRLLADIGTEASVPRLEKMQQRQPAAFRGLATLALRSIRQAKRKPTSEWAN